MNDTELVPLTFNQVTYDSILVSRRQLESKDHPHFKEKLGFIQDHLDRFEAGLDEQFRFESQLEILNNGHREGSQRVLLFDDFAPLSFGFMVQVKDREGDWKDRYNGGLIFHGGHDSFGDGGPPSYNISLTAVHGWSLHT